MSRHHDKWYTRLFSDPRIVEELLRSFVHEDFVKDLDFSSIKKLTESTENENWCCVVGGCNTWITDPGHTCLFTIL